MDFDKINIECVSKHFIVGSVLKRQFFSQEILGEERLHPQEVMKKITPCHSIWQQKFTIWSTLCGMIVTTWSTPYGKSGVDILTSKLLMLETVSKTIMGEILSS